MPKNFASVDDQASDMTPARHDAGVTIPTGDAVVDDANEFGRPSEVRPDNEPVPANTDDKTIRCITCKQDLIAPKAAIDGIVNDVKKTIACPTCHNSYGATGWEFADTGRPLAR